MIENTSYLPPSTPPAIPIAQDAAIDASQYNSSQRHAKAYNGVSTTIAELPAASTGCNEPMWRVEAQRHGKCQTLALSSSVNQNGLPLRLHIVAIELPGEREHPGVEERQSSTCSSLRVSPKILSGKCGNITNESAYNRAILLDWNSPFYFDYPLSLSSTGHSKRLVFGRIPNSITCLQPYQQEA
nr:hypothetical protein Iba_chr11bCG2330 [Ipomoea batatas]